MLRRVRSSVGIFDLEPLEDLSSVPNHFLLVSERTLYLLQNAVIADLSDPMRYAVAFYPESYRPVTEYDPEYSTFEAVKSQAALDLTELPMQGNPYGISYAELSGHQLINQAAGDYDLNIDPVPSGELWEVQALHLYTTKDYNNAIFRIVDGAGNLVVSRLFAPGANQFFVWQGRVTLSPGQYPECRVKSILADGDMTFYVWYVKLA